MFQPNIHSALCPFETSPLAVSGGGVPPHVAVVTGGNARCSNREESISSVFHSRLPSQKITFARQCTRNKLAFFDALHSFFHNFVAVNVALE